MRRVLRLTIVLIVAAAALAPAWPARACSCIAPGPPADELARSTAVFAGQATGFQMGEATVVTFQVGTVWKGPVESTLLVQTARDSAACGYAFEIGREYLVYAGGSPEALEVNLCSRTRLMAEAGEDVAALGEGETLSVPDGVTPTPHQIMLPVVGGAPQPTTAPGLTPTVSSEVWLLIAGGATVALLLVRAWFNRRPPPKG
jgi:hypothetical protein